jgi:hypothetical protein
MRGDKVPVRKNNKVLYRNNRDNCSKSIILKNLYSMVKIDNISL